MKSVFCLFFLTLIFFTNAYSQSVSASVPLKTFQQLLADANLQFVFPAGFKEIKPMHNTNPEVNIDYAIALPNEKFEVWFKVKSLQQEQTKFKSSAEDAKPILSNSDSLYSLTTSRTAMRLAGDGNFTYKVLPPDVLEIFHADAGCSYQLNLRDLAETNHHKYGLLIGLQKKDEGYLLMLFLGNENGPAFYKKVNSVYYSVKFN